jgi:adenylate cyclase
LSDALSFARSRKAGLENEPRILADLANAYRLNGDIATALTTVDEAIEISTGRHARIPECLARIVRADLLLQSSSGDQKAEGMRELERARALMQETGAMLFENFINATSVGHNTARQISIKAS